jgi:hypothetical protein
MKMWLIGHTGVVAQQRSTFAKLQRDRDKKDKAIAKAERRAQRATAPAEPAPEGLAPDAEAAVLQELAEIHAAFEAGTMSADDFETRRDQLRSQLIS